MCSRFAVATLRRNWCGYVADVGASDLIACALMTRPPWLLRVVRRIEIDIFPTTRPEPGGSIVLNQIDSARACLTEAGFLSSRQSERNSSRTSERTVSRRLESRDEFSGTSTAETSDRRERTVCAGKNPTFFEACLGFDFDCGDQTRASGNLNDDRSGVTFVRMRR